MDEVVKTIKVSGFDPEGEPEIQFMGDGRGSRPSRANGKWLGPVLQAGSGTPDPGHRRQPCCRYSFRLERQITWPL
jgi:hypothetical protein